MEDQPEEMGEAGFRPPDEGDIAIKKAFADMLKNPETVKQAREAMQETVKEIGSWVHENIAAKKEIEKEKLSTERERVNIERERLGLERERFSSWYPGAKQMYGWKLLLSLTVFCGLFGLSTNWTSRLSLPS